MPKLIKDWNDLVGLESEKYTLKIDTHIGCGWIVPKDNNLGHNRYLSTHTFYGTTCKSYTQLLQECGFDVELDNWDKE